MDCIRLDAGTDQPCATVRRRRRGIGARAPASPQPRTSNPAKRTPTVTATRRWCTGARITQTCTIGVVMPIGRPSTGTGEARTKLGGSGQELLNAAVLSLAGGMLGGHSY